MHTKMDVFKMSKKTFRLTEISEHHYLEIASLIVSQYKIFTPLSVYKVHTSTPKWESLVLYRTNMELIHSSTS